MIGHFLRQYQKLGFDFQLFHLPTDPKFYTSIPVYHSELLRAWTASGARIVTRPDSINHVLNLPLNCPILSHAADGEGHLPLRVAACGVSLVRHLLDFTTGRWIDAPTLITSFCGLRAPSLRLLHMDIKCLHIRLVSEFPSLFNAEGYILSTNQLQHVPFRPDCAIDFNLPSHPNGLSAPSKVLYAIFNEEINHHSASPPSHWHEQGFLETLTKLQWKNIYQLPTSKKEGDLQFRLFHNFLPSLAVLHPLNPDISSFCGWCGEKGSIHHLFITCPAIQPALNLLHSLLNRLLPSLQFNFDLYWALIPHAKGRNREAVRLANFLIISCKNVIYFLYRTSRFTDPLTVWQHRLKHRILLEYTFFQLSNNINAFSNKWSPNNALFTETDGKLTWLI